MRPHYHIWLIGAACALAVLAVGSIFSLLGARDLGGVDGAQATPTAALFEIVPPGDLPATAIGPADAVVAPAAALWPLAPKRTPAASRALRVMHTPTPDRTALPAVTSP